MAWIFLCGRRCGAKRQLRASPTSAGEPGVPGTLVFACWGGSPLRQARKEARCFEPPWRCGAKRQLLKLVLIFIAGARAGACRSRLDLDGIAGKQRARPVL